MKIIDPFLFPAIQLSSTTPNNYENHNQVECRESTSALTKATMEGGGTFYLKLLEQLYKTVCKVLLLSSL